MFKRKKLSDKELQDMGRKLQELYETGYLSKRQAFLFSFLKGMVTGAGAFLGGTIVIALLIWILSLFDNVPLIGHLIDSVNRTIQNRP